MPSILDATSPEEFDSALQGLDELKEEEENARGPRLKADGTQQAAALKTCRTLLSRPEGKRSFAQASKLLCRFTTRCTTSLLEPLAAKGSTWRCPQPS